MDVIGKNAHTQRRAIGCESGLDAHWKKDERHGWIGVAGIKPQRKHAAIERRPSFLVKALEVFESGLAGCNDALALGSQLCRAAGVAHRCQTRDLRVERCDLRGPDGDRVGRAYRVGRYAPRFRAATRAVRPG